MNPTRHHPARGLRRTGFTLIEASIVTAIIGIGVIAIMQLLAAGTVSNLRGTQITTGLNLAKNIREATVGMKFVDDLLPANWGPESGETTSAYDDLDDFDGGVFSPPLDAMKLPLADMAGWEQRVRIQNVDEDALDVNPDSSNLPKGSTEAVKITVEIYQNGKYVCSVSWFAFDVTQI